MTVGDLGGNVHTICTRKMCRHYTALCKRGFPNHVHHVPQGTYNLSSTRFTVGTERYTFHVLHIPACPRHHQLLKYYHGLPLLFHQITGFASPRSQPHKRTKEQCTPPHCWGRTENRLADNRSKANNVIRIGNCVLHIWLFTE